MPFLEFLFQPKNELEQGGRSAAPVQGDEREPEKTCPNCHSRYIRYFGIGTEQVEEKVRELFPDNSQGATSNIVMQPVCPCFLFL